MARIIAPLAGGLRIARNHQNVVAGEQTIARNADMRTPGSAIQADGYIEHGDAIKGGGTITPFHLMSRVDEIMVRSDRELYTHDAANDEWTNPILAPASTLNLRTYAPTVRDQSSASVTTLGDFALAVWVAAKTAATQIWYSVTRISDGKVLVDETELTPSGSASNQPIVIAADNYWLVLYDVGAFDLRVRRVPLAALDTPTIEVTLHTYTVAPTDGYDAVHDGAGDILVLTLDAPGGTNTYFLWRLDATSTVTTNSLTSAGTTLRSAVLVYETSTPRLIAAGNDFLGRTLEVSRVDPTTLALIDQASHLLDAVDVFDRMTAVVTDATHVRYFAGQNVASAAQNYERYIEVVEADVSGSPTFAVLPELANAQISHRPWVLGGIVYLLTHANADSSNSGCFLVYDMTNRIPVARFYEGERAFSTGQPFATATIVGTRVIVSASFRTRADLPEGPVFRDVGVGLVTMDFASVRSSDAEYVSLSLWLAGGYIHGYDGREVFEADWHVLPEITLAAQNNGGFLENGKYSYAVFWEWEDGVGQAHRSAPTIVAVETVSNAEVDITIHGTPHSRKSDLQIRIARSLVNDASLFFVLNDADYFPPSGTSVTFVDGASDEDVSKLALYEQAGDGPVQPHEAVPAAKFLATEKERLWWGDTQIPELVHFSTKCVDGFGPGIVGDTASPAHVVGICDGQESTGMSQMDSNFVVFSTRGIVTFGGPGPSRLVNGPGAFTVPIEMPSTLGTSGQELVARTNEGIAYVTSRGPRLLGRDRTSYFPFDEVSQFWTQLSADTSTLIYMPEDELTFVFDQNLEQLLGELDHPPQTCRYSHKAQRWATDSGAQAIDAHRLIPTDRLLFIRHPDNRVCEFVASTKQRGGQDATMVLCTGWLTDQPYGVEMTIEQIGVAGQFDAEHIVKIAVGYDWDERFTDVFTLQPNPGGVWRTPIADVLPPPDWMKTGLGFNSAPSSDGAPVTSGSRYHMIGSVQRDCYALRVALWFEPVTPPLEKTAMITSIFVEYQTLPDAKNRLPRLPADLDNNGPA